MKTRVAARVIGRVQGVGFRPTVYRYAMELGLSGFVRNDPQGVVLEIEGEQAQVDEFFRRLRAEPPPQAQVEGIQAEVLAPRGADHFEVVESEHGGDLAALTPPDLATCDDCLDELNNPADRRCEYPFLNCTNCGPRFTIIRDLPYDRGLTSMAGFRMCPPCDREYHDPTDRRFHAQPTACPDCGPRLEWKCGRMQERPEERTREQPQSSSLPTFPPSALTAAVALLQAGGIVAIKSLGGYHLAGDAFRGETVALLRARKTRPHQPLAVMFRDLETAREFAEVSEAEEAELLSAAAPIVILKRRLPGDHQPNTPTLHHPNPPLPHSLSPDSPTIGAFLPYTPLHHLLLRHCRALVMTSGNRRDEPIVSDERELPALLGDPAAGLGPIADAALTHNRPIVHKCDDSVVRLVLGQRQFLRRARGFVPTPIRYAEAGPHLLAVGGELKNTFCLARDGQAFVSQHLGDLTERRVTDYFVSEIAAWQRLWRVRPRFIAHDLHPAYRSTRLAEAWKRGSMEGWTDARMSSGKDDAAYAAAPAPGHSSNLPFFQPAALLSLIPVQHHHAHVASVMAEHRLGGPVIGLALDGTGYGPDGTVWGGEVLVADRAQFERVAHFKAYPLPGGERAITAPWRMAVSALRAEGLPAGAAFANRSRQEQAAIEGVLAAGINCPLTSSAGRLFDVVAALLGLADEITYEAQAAIRLEAVADPAAGAAYPFAVAVDTTPWRIDFGPTIAAVLADRGRGAAVATIAGRFHRTVAAALLDVCCFLRERRELETVVLSGGVFQNELLLRLMVEGLRRRAFAVFTNTLVPPNDGGLALGQVAVASARLAGEGEQE